MRPELASKSLIVIRSSLIALSVAVSVSVSAGAETDKMADEA